jgi:hypothetical protein
MTIVSFLYEKRHWHRLFEIVIFNSMKTIVRKSVIAVLYLLVATACSNKSDEILSDFVISDLTYDNTPILITNQPYFEVSGSIKFQGAHNGVKGLRLTSSLGTDITAPITDVTISSGQLFGYFTFEMIQTPGTYTFDVWLTDGAGRSSNKLGGSIKLISDAAATPVTLLSVTWDVTTKTPLLTWTKNNDNNFKAYAITRHQGGAAYEEIRILDQNVTSAHAVAHMAVGFDATFSVDVVNQVEATSPSNQIEITFGDNLPFVTPMPVYEGERPVVASTRNEMYLIDNSGVYGLVAVSTTNNTILRSYAVNSNINHLALSKDDSKLYVISYDVLRILNAENFNLIKQVYLSFFGGAIICGRADRLYVVSKGTSNGAPDTGTIKILDATTGEEVADTDLIVPGAQLAISPDNNTLYVADLSNSQSLPLTHKGKVYQMDVSTDVASVTNQQGTSDFIIGIQLSADGQTLFVAHDMDYPATPNKFVDAWSAATLQSLSKFFVPHPVYDFVVNASSLFISVGEGDNAYFGVSKFDLSTKTEMNSWEFLYPGARVMQLSQDGKHFYVFQQDKTWIVQVP